MLLSHALRAAPGLVLLAGCSGNPVEAPAVVETHTTEVAAVAPPRSERPVATSAPRVNDPGPEAPVAARVRLATIELHDIGDEDLDMLSSFDSLQTLSLSYSAVSDRGLKRLASLTGLASLDLSHTKLVGPGLADLAGLPNLTALDLSGTRVDDEGLKRVSACVRLTTLRLGSSGNGVIDAVDRLHLERVGGGGGPSPITAPLDCLLAPQTSAMRCFEHASAVTDAGLVHLAALGKLEVLDLSGCYVRDAGLVHLAKLGRMTRLSLRATDVGDAGMKALAAVPELDVLDLSDTSVTDVGLIALAASPRLGVLDVRSTRVTAEGVDAVRKARPGCRIFTGQR